MSNSKTNILESVKDYCLVPEETTVYDGQLLECINSAFFTIFQLGGTKTPYNATEESEWDDIPTDSISLSIVKPAFVDYVQKKTKLTFDPPANSFLVTAMEKQVTELESRISYAVDPGWEVEG